MEIGSSHTAQSVAQSVAPQTQTPRQSETAKENAPAGPATTEANQSQATQATQQVQAADETQAKQATAGATTPEPDPSSREGVGRFIDTVV